MVYLSVYHKARGDSNSIFFRHCNIRTVLFEYALRGEDNSIFFRYCVTPQND